MTLLSIKDVQKMLEEKIDEAGGVSQFCEANDLPTKSVIGFVRDGQKPALDIMQCLGVRPVWAWTEIG